MGGIIGVKNLIHDYSAPPPPRAAYALRKSRTCRYPRVSTSTHTSCIPVSVRKVTSPTFPTPMAFRFAASLHNHNLYPSWLGKTAYLPNEEVLAKIVTNRQLAPPITVRFHR